MSPNASLKSWRQIAKVIPRKWRPYVGLLLLVGVLIWIYVNGVAGLLPATYSENQVVKVVDGDTIDVYQGGKTQRVRLIGVDTPEVADPRKPVQCFGREASSETKRLVQGKTVRLVADTSQDDTDKYGRLLRYVYLPDGTFVNRDLIANGYAFEYTFRVPYQYQQQFMAAENAARRSDKGLWSPDTCNGKR